MTRTLRCRRLYSVVVSSSPVDNNKATPIEHLLSRNILWQDRTVAVWDRSHGVDRLRKPLRMAGWDRNNNNNNRNSASVGDPLNRTIRNARFTRALPISLGVGVGAIGSLFSFFQLFVRFFLFRYFCSFLCFVPLFFHCQTHSEHETRDTQFCE